MDKMTKNYKISGSGVLYIDGNDIVIGIEDKGEFNLASVLSDLNERPVKFSFSYDEDYEKPEVAVNSDTGEVIE